MVIIKILIITSIELSDYLYSNLYTYITSLIHHLIYQQDFQNYFISWWQISEINQEAELQNVRKFST